MEMDEEEETMVEEEKNEDEGETVEYDFTVYEIDLDYEFDAARYFDFSRIESPSHSSLAESWFDSAPSYPPSPFVARLASRLAMEIANVSPKSKGVEKMNVSESGSDSDLDEVTSAGGNSHKDDKAKDKISSHFLKVESQQKFQTAVQKSTSGLTFYNHAANIGNTKTQAKMSIKPSVPRTSTLMKPTASQLAKQNRPLQAGYPRGTSIGKMDKVFAGTCIIENQAAKRQKLEGGLLRKVAGGVQLQQTNFLHKAPKREALIDRKTCANPRVTIAREPDLETTYRAQRTRQKSIKEFENETSAIRKFKARPLNRKILDAPSLLPKKTTPRRPDFQEFHLKTSERAMQYGSTFSKSTMPYSQSNKDVYKCTPRTTTECENQEHASRNASTSDAFQTSHNFKALPLNKKILTSRGAIGIFRNSKKETTVPMEFNFQTEKRQQHHNPPIELFNKLSLASDSQPLLKCEPKLPWSIGPPAKGSKENRWGFQQVNETSQNTKAKHSPFIGNQQFTGNDRKNVSSASGGINWVRMSDQSKNE